MEIKSTTWGDCPNPRCPFYGRMQYGIEPGDDCQSKNGDRGCYSELRWWDRWHNGKHGFRSPEACTEGRDVYVLSDGERFNVECYKHGTVTSGWEESEDAQQSAYIHLRQDPDAHPHYLIVGDGGKVLFEGSRA